MKCFNENEKHCYEVSSETVFFWHKHLMVVSCPNTTKQSQLRLLKVLRKIIYQWTWFLLKKTAILKIKTHCKFELSTVEFGALLQSVQMCALAARGRLARPWWPFLDPGERRGLSHCSPALAASLLNKTYTTQNQSTTLEITSQTSFKSVKIRLINANWKMEPGGAICKFWLLKFVNFIFWQENKHCPGTMPESGKNGSSWENLKL